MSSSNEETVDNESPLLIKSRPIPRKKSSSLSNENDSPEGAADSALETDDDTEEAESTEKSPRPLASKSASTAKATIVRSNGKSKTYDLMIHEAMKTLSASKRLGVSIQRIQQYMKEVNEVPYNRVKFFFKKAIDKGLKENIYVHTSGTGCRGSIAFSTAHWNGLKTTQKNILKAAAKEEKLKLKAAEKEEKSKVAAKSKPRPKQKNASKPTEIKLKSGANVKITQPVKDQNNNSPVSGAATKKTKKLSKPVPTVKAKPKLKPKANKVKSKAEARQPDVPQTKASTRSKS